MFFLCLTLHFYLFNGSCTDRAFDAGPQSESGKATAATATRLLTTITNRRNQAQGWEKYLSFFYIDVFMYFFQLNTYTLITPLMQSQSKG